MKYPKLRELREAFKCIFSKPFTVKYPFAPAKVHPRFRGKPEFQDTCVGCEACSKVCPPGAIEIIDDVKNKKRKIFRYFDRCITCSECERVCTVGNGVKFLPEFAFAAYDRKDLIDTIEFDLIVCEYCGRPIATKKHILWLLSKLEEKGAAFLPYLILNLKEMGIVEEVEKKVTLDKRQDLFAILCSRCRHKIVLYDSI